jgi:elongation factor G
MDWMAQEQEEVLQLLAATTCEWNFPTTQGMLPETLPLQYY